MRRTEMEDDMKDSNSNVRIAARDVPTVRIDALKPYARNAKRHGAEQIEQLRASLREFGFVAPVLIDDEGNVLAGHGRLEAARAEGMTEVPCVRVGQLSEAQRRAYIIADNRLTELGTWDMEALQFEMRELADMHFDTRLTGFELDAQGAVIFDEAQAAPDAEPREAAEDDFDVAPPSETSVHTGDVFALGEHRLMCGDSSSAADMAELMGGEPAQLVFTAPPYGVKIGDSNKARNKAAGKAMQITDNIVGDDLDENALRELLLTAFRNVRGACAESASYYITSPQGGSLGLMMMMMRDAGLEVRHVLMWRKSSATFSMRRLDYDYQHEPIFYTWGKRHRFYGGGEFKTSVWDVEKPRKCDLHPTMKPIRLIANAVLNSSAPGDIVLDAFGGSGATLIACEQLDRKCRMMEIDPRYVQVIINRWEALTGKRAVKLTG